MSSILSNISGLLSGKTTAQLVDLQSQLNAIDKVMGVIEFTPEGTITRINDNFLNVVGYSQQELLGQHHRMLVDAQYASSNDYRSFWSTLAAGQYNQGQFKRVAKGNKEVWLEASYNPIFGADGKVVKVIKFATDITAQKQLALEATGQLKAINASQGVIEFGLDGKVLSANDNFLATLGYSLQEAVGQHHSAFVKADYRNSPEYREFWAKLNRGEAVAGTFERVGKGGKQIWLEASYNPIFDAAGKPYKVVKFAIDVTLKNMTALDASGQLSAINKILGVIEFDLQGKILKVNDNFAKVTGYSTQEIVGNHHSMFVEASYKSSAEYKAFWDKLARGEAAAGQYKRMAKGNKEVWLEASYNPIFDLNGKPYKVVKYATDITAEREAQAKAVVATQIKNTLDSASANMMMADNDGIIRYMNNATLALMRNSTPTFRKVFPHFDADKLIGQNFDVFHKNPAHQRNLLANITQAYEATVPVDDLIFKLKASPIVTADGVRAGTAIEWVDVTAERKIEQEIADIVQKASDGDLTARLSLEGKVGANVVICNGINAIVDKMAELITQVREAGETINTAANEISTGNNDLSSRTEQQASSLEETASSMEQLASTVKQNAENAKQANQLAAAASGVAIQGGQAVSQVVTTMSAINQSAHKIEDIISVIDGIAFQTNILALNAAVEAARAGEQGRGFAVVAGEVRNLAQRSASAAKEIKELITDSVTKTAEGTKQVENAGNTMQEIVSSVQRVTDIMGEIAAASSEQSAGIDQVNHAITSMDEVTQQNAALVEEAAAAAESLVEQAVSLMDTVSSFRLAGGHQQQVSRRQQPVKTMSRPVVKAISKPIKASADIVLSKTGTHDADEWEEF